MKFKKNLSPLALTLWVAALLLPCVTGFFYTLQEFESRERHRSLENRAQTQFQIIQSTFEEVTSVLQALRSVIEIKPDINSREFDFFISSQDISDYGINAFEWLPKITTTELPHWIHQVKLSGQFDYFSNFDPNSQNKRIPDVFPIRFSASSQMRGLSLGTNLAQDPFYSPLLLKAVDSSSVQLAIDNTVQRPAINARFLLAAFEGDQYTYSHLLGFVATSFNFAETIDILLGNSLIQLNLCLVIVLQAPPTSDSPQQLYSNCAADNHRESIAINQHFAGADLTFTFYNLHNRKISELISVAQLGTIAFFLAAIFGLYSLFQTRKHSLEIESLIKQKQAKLTDITEDYSQLFMLSVDGLYRADLSGNLLEANPAFASAFGFSSNLSICQQVTKIQEQLYLSASNYQDFIQHLLADGQVINYEWLGVTVDNQPVWLTENAYLVKDDYGNISHYQGFISIISERKQAEQSLQYQADYDFLTGLRNRASFVGKL